VIKLTDTHTHKLIFNQTLHQQPPIKYRTVYTEYRQITDTAASYNPGCLVETSLQPFLNRSTRSRVATQAPTAVTPGKNAAYSEEQAGYATEPLCNALLP